MILKTGMLKKKGIIFYNNRLVSLSVRGLLSYYDPKQRDMSHPKGIIDLNHKNVIVKFNAK